MFKKTIGITLGIAQPIPADTKVTFTNLYGKQRSTFHKIVVLLAFQQFVKRGVFDRPGRWRLVVTTGLLNYTATIHEIE